MPFKVTPYRLEMIADISCLLGVVLFIVLLASGNLLLALVPLLAMFVFSYLLYAAAKILKNTEEILERLEAHEENEEEEENEE